MANCTPENPVCLLTNLYQAHNDNKNLSVHCLFDALQFFFFLTEGLKLLFCIINYLKRREKHSVIEVYF